MVHDETQSDDPMVFIPERHLTSAGTLAEGTSPPVFGFGRWDTYSLSLDECILKGYVAASVLESI